MMAARYIQYTSSTMGEREKQRRVEARRTKESPEGSKRRGDDAP